MSDLLCGVGSAVKAPEAKKTNIACVESSLNGSKLVDAMKALNVNIDMPVSKKWLGNKSSGYPQLAQAIAKLAIVDSFAEFKKPDFGTVPIENIADTFAKSLGKSEIAMITEDDYKKNYAKLRSAILFRWKEKHSKHLVKVIKEFKQIVNITKSGSAKDVDLEDYK